MPYQFQVTVFFLFPVYNYTGALVTMVGRLKALGDYGPINTQIRETLDR